MAGRNKQLLRAAGSDAKVKLLVAEGADPAYNGGTHGCNAIMWASYHNRLAIAKYLLTLPGNHVAAVDKMGRTCLTQAVENGNYDVAALLLKEARVVNLLSSDVRFAGFFASAAERAAAAKRIAAAERTATAAREYAAAVACAERAVVAERLHAEAIASSERAASECCADRAAVAACKRATAIEGAERVAAATRASERKRVAIAVAPSARKATTELAQASTTAKDGGIAASAVVDAFECPICNDTCVELASTPCGHNFCLGHLRQWVTEKASSAGGAQCPVCRAPIQQRAQHVRVNTAINQLVEAAQKQRIHAYHAM